MTDWNAELRGTQQQLKDEFEKTFKRMNDPEEQEKAQRERDIKESLQDLQTDAGL